MVSKHHGTDFDISEIACSVNGIEAVLVLTLIVLKWLFLNWGSISWVSLLYEDTQSWVNKKGP